MIFTFFFPLRDRDIFDAMFTMFVGYFHGIWQSSSLLGKTIIKTKGKSSANRGYDRQRVCVFFLDNLGNVIINGVHYEFKLYILVFAYICA